MDSVPRISVVIPTYNRAGYLVQALDSVLAQTCRDFEVIVVDDGSTDHTTAAVGPYLDRIRYFRQENLGAAASRNHGIREARGEWIAFLDSDDMWQPHTLETLVLASRRYPDAGLIAVRAHGVSPDGTIVTRAYGKRSAGPDFTTSSLLCGDAGGVLTPMVHSRVLRDVGVFDESLQGAEDCDLWLRISFHTRMVGLPDALLLRRMHGGNLSGDHLVDARMWLRSLEKFRHEHEEFVNEHGRDYRRALGKQHLRLGRECLVRYDGDAAVLAEARINLKQCMTLYPLFVRAWVYYLWSVVGPSTYGWWRRWEHRVRTRVTH